jgi:hypothetical protein
VFINIFEYRMRSDFDVAAYQDLSLAMYDLVSSDDQFEFLDMSNFATSPTEGVVIERFGSLEGARLWASNSDHQKAMGRGQREFYAWYRGSGCVLDHEYYHPAVVEDLD